jgi:hypothetical protein
VSGLDLCVDVGQFVGVVRPGRRAGAGQDRWVVGGCVAEPADRGRECGRSGLVARTCGYRPAKQASGRNVDFGVAADAR